MTSTRILFAVLFAYSNSIAWADDPPICTPTTATTIENDRVVIPATCNDDNALSGGRVVDEPAHGTVWYDSMFDQYYYYPDQGFSGTDSFTFSAEDDAAQLSVPVAATITVEPLPSGGMSVGSCYMQASSCSGDCDCTGYGIASIRDIAMSNDGKNIYTVGLYFWNDGVVSTLSRNTATGALSQAARPAGCVSWDGNDSLMGECGTYALVKNASGVLVSPDDSQVYVLAYPNSDTESVIVIFDRDSGNGSLSNPRCFSRAGNSFGCTEGHANFTNVTTMAISPDGKNLYAGSIATGSIAILNRNSMGNLSQDPGEAGCFGGIWTPNSCRHGLHPAPGLMSKILLSPDGKVYVGASNAIYTLSRDPDTGLLSQDATEAGCISDSESSCADGRALASLADLALSGDGRNLYASSDSNGALTQVDRDVLSGILTQQSSTSVCYKTSAPTVCQDWPDVSGAPFVALDPQGENALVSTWVWDGIGSNYAVLERLTRAEGGALGRPGQAGNCLGGFGSCLEIPLLLTNPGKVLFSSDGLFAYFVQPNGILTIKINRLPACSDRSVSVPRGTSATVALTCTDPNGDTITRNIVTQPAHGALGAVDQDAGTVVYTADSNYQGSDTFLFRGSDGSPGSTATISISVTNTAPSCSGSSITVHHGSSVSVPLSCTDSEDTITRTITGGPSHGSLGTIDAAAGTVSYTADPGYAGPDSFSFQASDGLATTEATVSITVTNSSPSCVSRSVSVHHGSAVSVPVTCTDPEDSVVLSIATQPSHGTLTQIDAAAGTVTYTPDEGYAGSDSFTFQATDGPSAAQGNVSIAVTNTAPSCSNGAITTRGGAPENAAITCSDADGDALTYSVITSPARGTLGSVDSDAKKVVYTPTGPGEDTFVIRASDGAAWADASFTVVNNRATPRITLGQYSKGFSKALPCGNTSKRACSYRRSRLSYFGGLATPEDLLSGRQLTFQFYRYLDGRFKRKLSASTQINGDGSYRRIISARQFAAGLWMVKAISSSSTFISGAHRTDYFRISS